PLGTPRTSFISHTKGTSKIACARSLASSLRRSESSRGDGKRGHPSYVFRLADPKQGVRNPQQAFWHGGQIQLFGTYRTPISLHCYSCCLAFQVAKTAASKPGPAKTRNRPRAPVHAPQGYSLCHRYPWILVRAQGRLRRRYDQRGRCTRVSITRYRV